MAESISQGVRKLAAEMVTRKRVSKKASKMPKRKRPKYGKAKPLR